jgi:phosphatidate cytidylyltransferase
LLWRNARLKGLLVRVVSGTSLLALVLVAIWLGGLLLMVLVALAAGLAAHEFFSMARRGGYAPWYPGGVALSLLLAMRGYITGDLSTGTASPQAGYGAEVPAVIAVALLFLLRQGYVWLRAPVPAGGPHGGTALTGRTAWADLGLTLAGALYTGGLLGYAPLLAARSGDTLGSEGMAWLLMVLLGAAACDTGAYFVGSTLGRHKLIPHISPGKTWEGLAGGVLGGVIAALALSGLLHISVPQAVVLGVLVCVAAVAGDLCESLLKRAVGVKDSGNLIPGHGGILDRLDSVLFVLLAVYWFAQIVIRV